MSTPSVGSSDARVAKDRFDAVLFDLDGVITATARVHAAAWKRLFDTFLERRAEKTGQPFVPFDIQADYQVYVDGKPRYEGVRSFLESRGIRLPQGSPEDAPGDGTVCALGNAKNRFFRDELARQGVDVFDTTMAWAKALRDAGIRIAVVSSSKNTPAILERAGLGGQFDLVFDGNDAARLALPGKPNPNTFLKAAELLGVAPERAVVVEDAISGVQAGKAGGFGLVIGVDRVGQAKALAENGADVVVRDLGEMPR